MGHAEALGMVSGGTIAVVIIILLVIVGGWLSWRLIRKKVKEVDATPEAAPIEIIKPVIEAIPDIQPEYVTGQGGYKCLLLKDGILQPSTINKPAGNIFISDPSMPITGALYLVRENNEGVIEAYDPRSAPFNEKETPYWAYFAISWDVVGDVFNYVSDWWKNSPLWVTIASLVLLLIVIMICLG